MATPQVSWSPPWEADQASAELAAILGSRWPVARSVAADVAANLGDIDDGIAAIAYLSALQAIAGYEAERP